MPALWRSPFGGITGEAYAGHGRLNAAFSNFSAPLRRMGLLPAAGSRTAACLQKASRWAAHKQALRRTVIVRGRALSFETSSESSVVTDSGLADFEHLRATGRAGTRGGRLAILHRRRSRVLHLFLSLTLNAICLQCAKPLSEMASAGLARSPFEFAPASTRHPRLIAPDHCIAPSFISCTSRAYYIAIFANITVLWHRASPLTKPWSPEPLFAPRWEE